MAGGSPEHAAVAANVTALLSSALRDKPCRVFSSDLRVRVVETGLGTYPDVSVVCGRVEIDPEDPKGHTVVNPRIVVEVSSPSTEAYDRGDKLDAYKKIASLEDFVLVAHDAREVVVWRREAGGAWSEHATRGEGVAVLQSFGCALPLPEIYRDPLTT